MHYAIGIYASPSSGSSQQQAIDVINALLQRGHQIVRIFFFGEGSYVASRLLTPPQDERPLVEQWQALAREHQIELVVCIAAALRRGILNEQESRRFARQGDVLAEGFILSGLGQWIDAAAQADRVITFGGA